MAITFKTPSGAPTPTVAKAPEPNTPDKGGQTLPPYNPKKGSAAYKRYMSEAQSAQTVAEKIALDPEGEQRMGLAIHRLIAQGKVTPRPARDLRTTPTVDRTSPELIEQFTNLLMVGANSSAIRAIMQLTQAEYDDLHKSSVESMIAGLANTGILGTVALSFSTLQEASRRALQALAQIDDKAENRSDLLSTIQVVTQVEKAKIDLLIRTGAVKVKKHVELTARFEPPGSHSNIDTFNSEKARSVMVEVAAALAEDLVDSSGSGTPSGDEYAEFTGEEDDLDDDIDPAGSA